MFTSMTDLLLLPAQFIIIDVKTVILLGYYHYLIYNPKKVSKYTKGSEQRSAANASVLRGW